MELLATINVITVLVLAYTVGRQSQRLADCANYIEELEDENDYVAHELYADVYLRKSDFNAGLNA